jgi:hypothetical protein
MQIFKYGMRYPSGDNCQPFKISKISANEFLISYDISTAKHILNADNIPSIISLGALIESISIGASQFSCYITTKPEKDFGTEGTDWLSFKIFRADIPKDNLINSITNRHTDRGNYKIDLSDFELKRLDSSLQKSIQDKAVQVLTTKITDKIISYFVHCEEIFWKEKQIVRDLSRWIKFKKTEIPKDGFTWKNLSLSFFEAIALVFLARNQFLINIFEPILTLINKAKMKKSLHHSAGIIFFAIKDDSKMGILNSGRSMMRAWLTITEQGYVAQPLSISSILPYTLKKKIANMDDSNKDWQNNVITKNTELSSLLNIDSTSDIIWAFRFGKPINSSRADRSGRDPSKFE